MGELRSGRPELEIDETAPSCDEGRAENEAEGESDSAMLTSCLVYRLHAPAARGMCEKESNQEPVFQDKDVATDVVQSEAPPPCLPWVHSHTRAYPDGRNQSRALL